MEDIDYGAVFGITPEGAEETEAADPSTDTDETQGEKEQEAADPAVEEQTETGDGGEPEAEAAEDSQEEGAEGEKQTPEKNAKYAAARRKAEAERDAAVAKAKQEAEAEAQRVIDEAFKNSGLTNPYPDASQPAGWRTVVEDVKSRATRTREYIIKRKLMLEKYNIEIREV